MYMLQDSAHLVDRTTFRQFFRRRENQEVSSYQLYKHRGVKSEELRVSRFRPINMAYHIPHHVGAAVMPTTTDISWRMRYILNKTYKKTAKGNVWLMQRSL